MADASQGAPEGAPTQPEAPITQIGITADNPVPSAPESPDPVETKEVPTEGAPVDEKSTEAKPTGTFEVTKLIEAAHREVAKLESYLNTVADTAQGIEQGLLHEDHEIKPLPKVGDEGRHYVQVNKE